MADRAEMLARFEQMDQRLQARGFPATSPWWMREIARFLGSRATTWVLRVGRRGGKSSTLCRLAVLFALFGDHNIPPGDRGVVAFVSTRKDEAASRLFTIKAILRRLDVPFSESGDFVDLEELPIRFAVFPCTVSGVSGPTCIAVIGDEVAKWRDAETGANPATEVLAALRPTMATQPGAVMILSSSPVGRQDAHAKAFDVGDTDTQIVAHAETWVANPTVTKERTRELEPDERVWLREYAAIPQANVAAAFELEPIDRAFAPWPEIERVAQPVIVVDASSGRKDAWTWGALGYVWESGSDVRRVALLDVKAERGRFFAQVSAEKIVDRVVADARAWNAAGVHGDQRESLMLDAAFQRRRVTYNVHDWTAVSKPDAVATVRRWLASGTLHLGDPTGGADGERETLRKELLNFDEKILPSGTFTFGARGNGHDDLVALLLTFAMADAAGQVPRWAANDPNRPPIASFGGARNLVIARRPTQKLPPWKTAVQHSAVHGAPFSARHKWGW